MLEQNPAVYELIVIDDGSTDNTPEILADYAHDARVNVVRTINKGQGAARNKGRRLAQGDYIYFLDADDVLSPSFTATIERLSLRYNNPDIIFFSGEAFFQEAPASLSFSPSYKRQLAGYFASLHEFLRPLSKIDNFSASPCLYVSKTSLWDELVFNEFYHEDEAILLPLVFSATTFVVVSDILFFRRVRVSSTMTMHKNEKHYQGLQYVIEQCLNIQATESDPLKKAAARRQLRGFVCPFYETAKQLDKKPDVKLIMRALVAIRSVRIVIRLLLSMCKQHITTSAKSR